MTLFPNIVETFKPNMILGEMRKIMFSKKHKDLNTNYVRKMNNKNDLILLDYYDEYSTTSNTLNFAHIRFIGYENVGKNNVCLRFQLDNGNQIRRMISDNGVEYKHAAVSDGPIEIVFKPFSMDHRIDTDSW